MYAISAKTAGATAVAAPEANLTADVEGLLARVTDRTRLLFLANPNNPTGSYLSESALQRLHKGLPDHVLLVIDAAYAEYVARSEEHTSELQSLMRISYAVCCLKNKTNHNILTLSSTL